MKELITIHNDIGGVLRTVCEPVKNIDSEVKAVAQDLIDYMLDHRYARSEKERLPVSLSAPQLGATIRVIVFYPNVMYKEKDGIEILINPELLKTRKFANLTESCLSIPKRDFIVRRARGVKVKGLTLDGRPKTYKAADFFAQVLQHEINHLDGVLIDKIGKLVK